jgi:hypothetical protein
MGIKLLFISTVVVFAIVFISGTMYNGGSPGGKTGSPKDAATCAQCHSSVTATVEWISTTIPGTGYVPGEVYTVTVNAVEASAVKMGFEVTAENASGKQGVFTITDEAKTKLTNGNKAVTHKTAGNTPIDGKISWNFNWTAPVNGSGDVTFYGAINAANGNGSTSGDKIYTSTLKVSEAGPNSSPHDANNHFILYPNPAYGFFFIESASEILNVNVYDFTGKLILHKGEINSSKATIDLDNTKPGLYIVEATTFTGEFTRKIELY